MELFFKMVVKTLQTLLKTMLKYVILYNHTEYMENE